MKFDIEIKATMSEKDPAYKTIVNMGLDKAIEKFKKELALTGVDSVEISIKESQNENG